MRKPKPSEAGKRQLQLLVVGGSEQDFTDLGELLAGADDGQVHLEHAISPEDVLNRFGKGSYDFLLCSSKSTDNAAFQLLRQVRQHDSGVPVIFLSNPVNKGVIEAAIQATACHHAAQSNHPEAYGSLRRANAFDAYPGGTPEPELRGDTAQALAHGGAIGRYGDDYGSIRRHGVRESGI